VIWLLAAAYAIGMIALGIAIGRRLKTVREAHERLAAVKKRSLGL
jgi:hypothetical protein